MGKNNFFRKGKGVNKNIPPYPRESQNLFYFAFFTIKEVGEW